MELQVRKIFQARDRLIVRTFEKEIDDMLGLAKFHGAVAFGELFKALDNHSDKAVRNMTQKKGKEFLKKKNNFKELIAKTAYESVTEKVNKDSLMAMLSRGGFGKEKHRLGQAFLDLDSDEMARISF